MADSEAVENELDLLQNELTELKDKYARVHADFDNIKQRVEHVKNTPVESAQDKYAKDLDTVMGELLMAMI